MGNDDHEREDGRDVTPPAQAEHPDPVLSAGMIRLDRAALYSQVPPWPPALIEPSEAELARWNELWRHPNAAHWIETGREHEVVELVRLEKAASASHPSRRARAGLEHLRRDLGVAD